MQEFRVVEVGVVEVQIGIAIGVVVYLVLVVAVFGHSSPSKFWRFAYRLTAVLLPSLPWLTQSVLDLSPDDGAARAVNVASFLSAYYMVPAIFLSGFLFSRTKRKKQNPSFLPPGNDASPSPM